jgi:cyclophilin family peptidyl-prolyl cis-trans isomerase
MRLLIILFLLSNLNFAQYDSTMYDLIKTTYERSFETPIINKYLNSDSDTKTKAALLSIAQSEDTSFIPELLKLNLNKYGSEVCFALGQIGKCEQSINFLWSYLHSSPPSDQFPKIFYAIGKIGDETDLNKLVEFYNSSDGLNFPYDGISEAILQFQIRGIKSDNARAILENEITHPNSGAKRIINSLFVLSRYSGSAEFSSHIEQYLSGTYFLYGTAQNDIELKQFVLMNVNSALNLDRVNPIFWEEFDRSNILLRIQFSKILHNLRFISKSFPDLNIDYYFRLLDDSNPNVALQTAISIKNIKNFLNDTLNISVKNKIDSLLFDMRKSMSFKGELLLSRYDLFGGYEEHEIILNELDLPTKFQIEFYAKNPNKEIAFNKLAEYYWDTPELKDKIEALTQILAIKSEPKFEADYAQVLINALTSNNAPLISIAADGIDSLFISSYEFELKNIIENQISKLKDNPNLLEATMSLINLAEKIDPEFYSQMIEKTKESKLYSIRKFIWEKTGNNQIGVKELDKFEDIWSCAFKFEQATIKTSKGNILIQFNSDIAPISVANFCMLAKQNFYNGIIFHRVVPGFVIQAGDPTATGWGGPGYDIISEYSDTDFGIGYIGMASAGKDTESSQFFIMHVSHPHLDSRYTIFAKVAEGMDVVYNITEDDEIISIKLK